MASRSQEGDDSHLLLCSSETPTGTLSSILGTPVQERHKCIEMGPEEGYKYGQRAGIPLLQGKAERGGAV